MEKKWMTKVGAALLGVGTFLSQVPPDVAIGTYHGSVITVGHITQALGVFFAVFGIGRKIDRMGK